MERSPPRPQFSNRHAARTYDHVNLEPNHLRRKLLESLCLAMRIPAPPLWVPGMLTQRVDCAVLTSVLLREWSSVRG
jgi:hypothetical protein